MAFRLWPLWQLVGVVVLTMLPGEVVWAQDGDEAWLSVLQLGPRDRGTAGYRTSQNLLTESMALVGLRDVHQLPPVGSGDWIHLTGVLSGQSATQVVLTAHYDSEPGSRGDLDNASGCAAILGAASELSRVPLRHTIRLVFTDGEEKQAAGSRAWLSSLSPEVRRDMVANLNVDMVGSRFQSGPGLVHIVAGWEAGRRVLSPAWLIHAVLQAGRNAEFPIAVLDSRWSWFAQLAVRSALPTRLSDGRSFVEVNVPSVTLSDISLMAAKNHHENLDGDGGGVDETRLRAWVRALSDLSRRVDALADRPSWETEYLVLFGRVWIRRDLVWAGFLLWVLLVWRGLPGPWRQQEARDRRRMGRSYLPGFAFRMLFLVAVFLVPTFATILLYPVGIVALFRKARRFAGQQVRCVLALLPTLFFCVYLAIGQVAGWFILDRAAVLPATLVVLTLATFCTWQLDPLVGQR